MCALNLGSARQHEEIVIAKAKSLQNFLDCAGFSSEDALRPQTLQSSRSLIGDTMKFPSTFLSATLALSATTLIAQEIHGVHTAKMDTPRSSRRHLVPARQRHLPLPHRDPRRPHQHLAPRQTRTRRRRPHRRTTIFYRIRTIRSRPGPRSLPPQRGRYRSTLPQRIPRRHRPQPRPLARRLRCQTLYFAPNQRVHIW